jgi:predicted  nucleic acid-binding Zn-ribbon protein
MSEETNTADDKAGENGTEEFKAITSQEALTKVIGARINAVKSQYADYDDLKAKAEQFDKATEATKTEIEKANERATKAEAALTPAQQQVARLEVALAKGLTATQAKRLVGTTKEEFAADADELLADLGSKPKPKPDPKGLKSGSSGSSEQQTGKEKAAAALRQLRGAGD